MKGYVLPSYATTCHRLGLRNRANEKPYRVFSYHPLKLSDHVFIGQNSIVEAAIVGNKVHIGKDCVIGKFALIKDCVRILDGTIVPPGMVIPSFSVVAGRPGRVVGEVPEGGEEALEGREIYRTIVN